MRKSLLVCAQCTISTEKKKELAREVVATIKSKGGRFLKGLSHASHRSNSDNVDRLDAPCDGIYIEVSDKVAVEKAKQCFRHQLRPPGPRSASAMVLPERINGLEAAPASGLTRTSNPKQASDVTGVMNNSSVRDDRISYPVAASSRRSLYEIQFEATSSTANIWGGLLQQETSSIRPLRDDDHNIQMLRSDDAPSSPLHLILQDLLSERRQQRRETEIMMHYLTIERTLASRSCGMGLTIPQTQSRNEALERVVCRSFLPGQNIPILLAQDRLSNIPTLWGGESVSRTSSGRLVPPSNAGICDVSSLSYQGHSASCLYLSEQQFQSQVVQDIFRPTVCTSNGLSSPPFSEGSLCLLNSRRALGNNGLLYVP